MSTQSRFPKTQPVVSVRRGRQQGRPERGYRALSGLAILCLVLGVLSLATFVDWSLAVVPVLAMLLGWIAVRRIRRNPEETTGIGMVRVGVGLAAGFWIAGYVWLAYQYSHWAPPGYLAIAYQKLQPDPNNPEQRVPEEAMNLDKRKVFIRGYMAPGKQRLRIREFVLAQEPGDCSYCKPTPMPTQLIRVKLKPPRTVDYTNHIVGVGGEFTVHEDPKEGGMGGLVYQIEADCIR